MLRERIKPLVELIVIRTGGKLVGRLRRRGRLLILAYHNVVPHGETGCGDRSLHLPQRIFGDQLDELLHDHDVVPLAELWSAPAHPSARPRAAVTFDDAYTGTLTAGLEELVRRGVPATVFVPPGFVGGRSFWWDELADGFAGSLPPDLRHHLVSDLAGDDERVRAWAKSRGLAMVTPPPWGRTGSEEDLRRAVGYGALSLGSHSWSHVNLAAVDPARRRDELVRSKAWLRDRFPRSSIPWLSYPYGCESAEAREAAADAGYVASVRATGGRFRPGAAPLQALPRLNVPAGVSPAGFTLRAAGLFAE